MNLDAIEALMLREGAARYGRESVSQLDHALQCAQLAEQAEESTATVAAALLHDLGHLVRPPQDTDGAAPASRDDLHQFMALAFLRRTFDDAVLEPIRLHVDAKRYLCHADPAYLGTLSAASVHSLQLQGGVFGAEEADAFLRQPHAPTAVRLRRYDDLAKVPGAHTPPLAHFLDRIRALVLPPPG